MLHRNCTRYWFIHIILGRKSGGKASSRETERQREERERERRKKKKKKTDRERQTDRQRLVLICSLLNVSALKRGADKYSVVSLQLMQIQYLLYFSMFPWQ